MLQSVKICDEVSPANVEDGAETALKETYVAAVGNPSLRAIESGKNHDPVDLKLSPILQAFVAPNTFVQSTK